MTLRTTMTTLAAVGIAAALAACGGSSGGGSSSTEQAAPPATGAAESSGGGNQLEGTVGPGFTITLTQNGQPVTSLPAGTYTIVVDDQANVHNFHLTGPGVDKATDVGGTGKTTWTVDLKAGSYHFQCDPHSSSMNGDFTVT